MASSGAIRSRINARQQELEATRSEIRRLQLLLENQLLAQSQALARIGDYYAEWYAHAAQRAYQASKGDRSVLAHRFANKLHSDVLRKEPGIRSALNNIQTAINREIKQTESLLGIAQGEEKSLMRTIDDLEDEYRRAVQREEEERRREALATAGAGG